MTRSPAQATQALAKSSLALYLLGFVAAALSVSAATDADDRTQAKPKTSRTAH